MNLYTRYYAVNSKNSIQPPQVGPNAQNFVMILVFLWNNFRGIDAVTGETTVSKVILLLLHLEYILKWKTLLQLGQSVGSCFTQLGLLENKQFMDVVSPVKWRKICKCIHFPEFESQFNLGSGKLHYFSDRY